VRAESVLIPHVSPQQIAGVVVDGVRALCRSRTSAAGLLLALEGLESSSLREAGVTA
jgi:hypothetical protein